MKDSENIRGFHQGDNIFDVYIDPETYVSMSQNELLTGKIFPKYNSEPERTINIQRTQFKTTDLQIIPEELEKIILRLSNIHFVELGMLNQGTYYNDDLTVNIHLL